MIRDSGAFRMNFMKYIPHNNPGMGEIWSMLRTIGPVQKDPSLAVKKGNGPTHNTVRVKQKNMWKNICDHLKGIHLEKLLKIPALASICALNNGGHLSLSKGKEDLRNPQNIVLVGLLLAHDIYIAQPLCISAKAGNTIRKDLRVLRMKGNHCVKGG
jgi:hypothetical protein